MTDPIAQFARWFDEARAAASEKEPNWMSLATATKDGAPSSRVVLLKAFDARGFVFYTNLGSRKSRELKENPRAALGFYWAKLGRQVRIEGDVEPVGDAEADEYYASRPLVSRIGAMASEQSRPLDSRATLLKKVEALAQTYSESNPPPRPPFWSGWRVVPRVIEFWQEGEYRLHDREVFTRAGGGWRVERLYP